MWVALIIQMLWKGKSNQWICIDSSNISHQVSVCMKQSWMPGFADSSYCTWPAVCDSATLHYKAGQLRGSNKLQLRDLLLQCTEWVQAAISPQGSRVTGGIAPPFFFAQSYQSWWCLWELLRAFCLLGKNWADCDNYSLKTGGNDCW